MKKLNILVFSSIYPISGTRSGFTPVVKYFCEEWVKQGHKVVVISSSSKFHLLYYFIPKILQQLFESRRGFVFPNRNSRHELFVEENGVKIYQLPIPKLYPGEIPRQDFLQDNFQKIVSFLKRENFTPNIALGHWVIPQINYLSFTKNYFEKCTTSLILHNVLDDKELEMLKTCWNDIDRIGFRSEYLKRDALTKIDASSKNGFICYSGVKDYHGISEEEFIPKKRTTNVLKICFVGTLIRRKFPEKIIDALNLLENESITFEVHYVGDGKMKDVIKNIPKKPNIEVLFHGHKTRDNVYEIIQNCDVLVMISERETFGLVYLEAMLNRTIPIASFNEGFDGIIRDGINGFLSTSGNAEELCKVFNKILELEENEYIEIQKNTFITAKNMTDDKMAKEYLNKLTQ